MNKKWVKGVTWVGIFHLGVIIVTSYLLSPNLLEQEIWMSHNCAPNAIEDASEYELRA